MRRPTALVRLGLAIAVAPGAAATAPPRSPGLSVLAATLIAGALLLALP
ncbi:MAG: hypothetical protein FJ027_07710 [Candidatus Rokubacteria bacterium]|nr:hypothetical protein [Candidatus Rokubacteria bacterium]